MTFVPCTLKRLPRTQAIAAAARAIEINPNNKPNVSGLIDILSQIVDDQDAPMPTHSIITADRIAAVTTLLWKNGPVRLGVGFMDVPSNSLTNRILAHMNAWGGPQGGDIKFVESQHDPEVRISRENDGYWSYLGVEILSIPRNQATMNLEGFTMNTPDSEFHRVVRHETGHTLGFPHEHMRKEIIARLDVQKTIRYFAQTQGWSRRDVMEQVLTPLDGRTITATENVDQESIMCYQLPGSITKDGQPIPGGDDITESDYEFVRKLYPKPEAPVIPPSPTGSTGVQIRYHQDIGYYMPVTVQNN